MIALTQIGRVESLFNEPADPFKMRQEISRIVIEPEFAEGLYRLDESGHIQVIFGFHLSTGYTLRHLTYSGEFKGNFASRSPHRPSPLGVSTVELLGIEDNVLLVKGLDAVNGTPVYDIKPFAPVYDAPTVE